MVVAGKRIAAVRRFNRFYTGQIGVLREGLLSTAFSLTEARVLYEIAQGSETTATHLIAESGMDAGHLSRLLARFEKRGLIRRKPARKDGRKRLLRLTPKGRRAFARLDTRAAEEVAAMLAPLPRRDQQRLVETMHTIQTLLGEPRSAAAGEPVVLRAPRSGDYGWIVHRHGVLYRAEYEWNEEFEGLVAQIVADYARKHDPQRERAWIAELNGEVAGCVFCVKASKTIAKLRILYVESIARGHGIGSRLVEECIRFAREAGYRKLTLWTNDVLHAARRIYERTGFDLVKEEQHRSFGHDLVGQYWSLDL